VESSFKQGNPAEKSFNPIDSLFSSAATKGTSVAIVGKDQSVVVVPKQRLTKRERKIKEQESDDRLISAIISDTKAGKRVPGDEKDAPVKRKRNLKS